MFQPFAGPRPSWPLTSRKDREAREIPAPLMERDQSGRDVRAPDHGHQVLTLLARGTTLIKPINSAREAMHQNAKRRGTGAKEPRACRCKNRLLTNRARFSSPKLLSHCYRNSPHAGLLAIL